MPHFKYGRVPRDTSRWAPALEDYLRAGPAAYGLETVADSEDVQPGHPGLRLALLLQRAHAGNPPAPTASGLHHAMAHAAAALDAYAADPRSFPRCGGGHAYSDVSGYDPATGANDHAARCRTSSRTCAHRHDRRQREHPQGPRLRGTAEPH